jgi:hypothetical protein
MSIHISWVDSVVFWDLHTNVAAVCTISSYIPMYLCHHGSSVTCVVIGSVYGGGGGGMFAVLGSGSPAFLHLHPPLL